MCVRAALLYTRCTWVSDWEREKEIYVCIIFAREKFQWRSNRSGSDEVFEIVLFIKEKRWSSFVFEFMQVFCVCLCARAHTLPHTRARIITVIILREVGDVLITKYSWLYFTQSVICIRFYHYTYTHKLNLLLNDYYNNLV